MGFRLMNIGGAHGCVDVARALKSLEKAVKLDIRLARHQRRTDALAVEKSEALDGGREQSLVLHMELEPADGERAHLLDLFLRRFVPQMQPHLIRQGFANLA